MTLNVQGKWHYMCTELVKQLIPVALSGFWGLFGFFFLKIYLSLAALGLRCCMQAFSSCGKQTRVAEHRLLFTVASRVAHGI